MFYNADALARLGYDDKSFPKTWDELEILASKLHRAGFACAYTTAYPAWILIESFIAIHNLPMLDLSGKRAVYNNKELVAHLKRLLRWQQLHYFEYGGRADDATILFTSGRCPLYTQSSGSYSSLAKSVSFRLGIASIPLDNKASIKRYNNVTGGAALWISTGQSQAIYKGIAKFFEYLTQTSAQLNWHQDTGYLPPGLRYRLRTSNRYTR